jgi:hypothetical protein
MALFNRKRSPLEERIRALEKQIGSVKSEIKAVEKGKRAGGDAAGPSRVVPQGEQPELFDRSLYDERPPAGVDSVRRPPDGRLANYLSAGSFQSTRPLRQEERVLRNRAFIMLALVVVILILIFASCS